MAINPTPNNDESSEKPRLNIQEAGQGSYVQPIYVERKITYYALPENELNSISLMNTLALVFFSVGSFLASLGFGIQIDAAFQKDMTPEAKLLQEVGAPILWSLAAVFGAVGGWAVKQRYGMLKNIRQESRVIQSVND